MSDAYDDYRWNKSQVSEIAMARRLFWQACASRAPLVLGRTEGPPWTYWEGSKDVAEWADRMLKEWDRRWISNREELEEERKAMIKPLIRANSWAAFRSGEWARITGVEVFSPYPSSPDAERKPPRVCFVVEFLDGEIDRWPVEDSEAEYEFLPSLKGLNRGETSEL